MAINASGEPRGASRRAFLQATAATAVVAASSGAGAAATAGGDLTWTPAWRLRDMIARKQVSPVEVLDHFLARIDRFNPTLKAFKHIDAEAARAQAKQAEAAVMRGDPLGPLHGLPTSVKEHIHVAGMPVLGLGAPNATATHDQIGVERLKAAGAIIIGTNTMMSTSSPGPGRYNWDAEARSPWDPSRQPGWSSSGGASAVAAGLLPFTIGSDGGGSTRLPAAISGVIGVHPTVGRIPSFNFQNPSLTLSTTIGPLARDGRDAAMVMQVMAGPDGRDVVGIDEPAPDYLANLDKGVRGLRFAWTDDFGWGKAYELPGAKRVVAVAHAAAHGFRDLGAIVEPTAEQWEDWFRSYQVTEQVFGARMRAGAAGRPAPTPDDIRAALENRGRSFRRFRDLFGKYDLLLSTTAQFTAYKVEDWDRVWTTDGPSFPQGTFAPHYTIYTHMFNWLGFPAVSVPCGFLDGLPVGLQIVGPPEREALVLQAAAAFTQAFPRHERPRVS